MIDFLWGITVAAFAGGAVFFLRFWRQTRDRLFAIFALAFLVLAGNYVALEVVQATVESRHYAYLLRLLAFLLIIAGIVDKNRRGRG